MKETMCQSNSSELLPNDTRLMDTRNDPETLLRSILNSMVTSLSEAGEEGKSRLMCKIDNLEEEPEQRVLIAIFFLFVAVLTVAIYMEIRVAVILYHGFGREKNKLYFPMLMLMYVISAINVLILVAGFFLPFVPNSEESGFERKLIFFPFVYALITPSLIALADLIMCVQRMWFHKSPGVGMFTERSGSRKGWIAVCAFIVLAIPISYTSFIAQRYIASFEKQRNTLMLGFFITDNVIKAVFSLISFSGYVGLFFICKTSKANHDPIIFQALPIAGFQLVTIGAQCFLELSLSLHKLSPQHRILIDICFSAASSVAVPLCITIGEEKKRSVFFSNVCCCFCYCEPRPPAPKRLEERHSKADRQDLENEEARKKHAERRNKRREEGTFDNLDESNESEESPV